MKKCSKCKNDKPEIEFHKNATYCKLCKRQYDLQNKDALREKRRLDHIKNRERDILCSKNSYQKNKEERKQYYEDNKDKFHDYYIKSNYGSPKKQIMAVLNRCKKRANKYNLQFDLDYDFVERLYTNQNGECLLTGIYFDLEKPTDSFIRPFSMSIDKIDSKFGYTKGNIRLVCSIVNFALGEFGIDNFDKMCESYIKKKGIQ